MVMNDMTDDGKWGAEIAIDGKRPEWLGAYVGPLKWYNEDQRHGVEMDNSENLNWGFYFTQDRGEVTAIRLPADHPHYQQTQPIDWSAAIGAVHEDGRVVAAQFVKDDGSTALPMFVRAELYETEGGMARYFNRDGSRTTKGWRIRNVQPATQTQTQTLTAQEHLARLEALVRKMAAIDAYSRQGAGELRDEARALVAEREPVDPEQALLEETAKAIYESYEYVKPWDHPDTVRIHHDHTRKAAAAAIRRGRELARGDVK